MARPKTDQSRPSYLVCRLLRKVQVSEITTDSYRAWEQRYTPVTGSQPLALIIPFESDSLGLDEQNGMTHVAKPEVPAQRRTR